MNKLQKITSDISGFTFENGELRANARNDYYYSCKNKIAAILVISDVAISVNQAKKIFNCLEALENCETGNSSDLFNILSNLK